LFSTDLFIITLQYHTFSFLFLPCCVQRILDTVFCVPNGLPPPCTSLAQRERGLPNYWWKEDDLVKGRGRSTVAAASDPWRAVGSGMRLDGGPAHGGGVEGSPIEGLTEDEMLQMALEASLENTSPPTMSTEVATVPLTDEPPAGTQGSCRIQFRLPNGSRAVRRFLESDPVGMIYAFVESESRDGQGKRLDLRCGFPPKDLLSVRNMTIGEATLAGESIQCRYI
jgi:ataxin-3